MFQNADQILHVAKGSQTDYDIGFNYVKLRSGDIFKGVIAREFRTISQKKYKTGIKDLTFSALDVIKQTRIKEYYYKDDVAKLYEMRANRQGNATLPTYKDINKKFGVIVEEAPSEIASNDGSGVDLYGMASLNIVATQEHATKTNDRLNQIEKVIINENNSKRRNVRKSGGRQLNAATQEKNIYLARVIELEAENQKLKDENEKLKPKSTNK